LMTLLPFSKRIGKHNSRPADRHTIWLYAAIAVWNLTRILSQLGVRDRTQAALWSHKHLPPPDRPPDAEQS
jgi:hypothetical protein